MSDASDENRPSLRYGMLPAPRDPTTAQRTHARRVLEAAPFTSPLHGGIHKYESTKYAHVGLAATYGDAVYPIGPGEVIGLEKKARPEATSDGDYEQRFGVNVTIKHPNGFVSRYAYLKTDSANAIELGQKVTSETQIGRVGGATIPELQLSLSYIKGTENDGTLRLEPVDPIKSPSLSASVMKNLAPPVKAPAAKRIAPEDWDKPAGKTM